MHLYIAVSVRQPPGKAVRQESCSARADAAVQCFWKAPPARLEPVQDGSVRGRFVLLAG